MIKFLLQEIEKSPSPLFARKELLSISSKDFKILTNKKILSYCRPSPTEMAKIRLPRCQHGCSLTVVQVEDNLEAVCLEHPEEEPIPITMEELNRYTFSMI